MSGSDRYKRNKAFGDERVFLLGYYYEQLGFHPIVYPHNAQGVDVIVLSSIEGRHIVEVVESTNYAKTSYIHKDKFERYVRSLDRFDCLSPRPLKTIVVSFLSNLSPEQRATLDERNIHIWEIGYQNIPEEYGGAR